MRLFSRADRPPAEALAVLPRGERVLAAVKAGGQWLLGTRSALVVVAQVSTRLPWEEIQGAEWSRDDSLLRITGVGEYGRPRPAYTFALEDPALLLQLVRERVTASIVLQRGVLTDGKRGFKVIGRRPPAGGEIRWMYEYDPGVDPADPRVVALAEEALAAARAEVGG